MNVKGVQLNNQSLKALRLMQSEESEMIHLYLSALCECEELLLTPDGIVPVVSDKKKLETLRLLRYLKDDLSKLMHSKNE